MTTVSRSDIRLIMIYSSTISALKYTLYAFYHLFVLCTGIRMLIEEDDSPAVVMPIPSRVIATSYPTKAKYKSGTKRTRRSKLRGYRNNRALLCLLRNDANKGNSTS